MKPSADADHSSNLTSFNRRAVLGGIAGSIAAPALIASTGVFANNATRGVTLAVADSDNTHELTHREVSLNGLRFHIAEAGQGPLVLLCHGFPECWYSWRHQLPALAEAGFHAVAPDMRGFGQTEAPDDIADYTLAHSIADMVQLVSALGEKQAVIIGHDWGAAVAWNSALLRPDIFRAVVAMSVPYSERRPVAPLKALRDAGANNFYWLYFQTPGVAEAEFERDVDRTVRTFAYGTGVSLMLKPGQGFLADTTIPQQSPSWLTDEDISYFVEAFKRSGYRGGLNWYRNLDRDWAISGGWQGLKIQQPALFIAGANDGVIKFMAKALEQLPTTVPGLKKTLPSARQRPLDSATKGGGSERRDPRVFAAGLRPFALEFTQRSSAASPPLVGALMPQGARRSLASRRMLQKAAPGPARTGASFEAASRRLRMRALG